MADRAVSTDDARQSIVVDPAHTRAFIFDMDGVLTDTAALHQRVWAETFDSFMRDRGEPFRPFSSDDYRRDVDGKPRLDGVRGFLASRKLQLPEGSAEDPPDAWSVSGLARRKNDALQAALKSGGADAYIDAVHFLEKLEQVGIAVAMVSSSRNAELIMRSAGLREHFSIMIDGVERANRGLAGKPAPDMFLAAAADLGVAPASAAVAEDAVSGIEAAKRGGFGLVLGIARGSNADRLLAAGAHVAVPSFDQVALATSGQTGEQP